MLYDPDTSLSSDSQSSVEAESVLANELNNLRISKSHQQISRKQRFMHFLQDKHIRSPQLIVQYGSQIIKNAASKLGSAVWDLYERVYIASLDIQDSSVANWCLTTLEKQWGNSSTRVQRLRAMGEEARGYYAEADDTYMDLLKTDPTNISVLKRQVACAKGAGELGLAIQLLTAYTKTFSEDVNAWIELGELYTQSQQYELAAFAYEELLMLSPENYVFHLKYAELSHTLGRMDVARMYYAQSLELKPNNNLRALYGLIALLKSQKNAAAANAPSTQELYEWSAEQLLAHYKKFNPHLTAFAEAFLNDSSSSSSSAASPATPTPTLAAAPTATSEKPTETQPTELPD